MRSKTGRSGARRSRPVVHGSLAAAALLALTACGGTAKNGEGLGRATLFPAAKRAAFPMLAGETVGGAPLDMASLKGKVIVVNVWGSWCPTCQKETPYLERGYETYGKQGVAFLGIDTRDDKAQAAAYISTAGVGYPSLFDDDSETMLSKLAGIVPLDSVPTTVIIDRDGRVAWTAPMPIDFTTLKQGLDPVLAEA